MDYPVRSASIGSTMALRRAGMLEAANPADDEQERDCCHCPGIRQGDVVEKCSQQEAGHVGEDQTQNGGLR